MNQQAVDDLKEKLRCKRDLHSYMSIQRKCLVAACSSDDFCLHRELFLANGGSMQAQLPAADIEWVEGGAGEGPGQGQSYRQAIWGADSEELLAQSEHSQALQEVHACRWDGQWAVPRQGVLLWGTALPHSTKLVKDVITRSLHTISYKQI